MGHSNPGGDILAKKTRICMVSIFFVWILVCTAFTGVAEEWSIKQVFDVEVGYTETEIMDPTLTNKKYNRKFFIENGENEVITTAWGSNDLETWEVMGTKSFAAQESGWLILGFNHYWHVKLTGKTVSVAPNSIVDATLYYREI